MCHQRSMCPSVEPRTLAALQSMPPSVVTPRPLSRESLQTSRREEAHGLPALLNGRARSLYLFARPLVPFILLAIFFLTFFAPVARSFFSCLVSFGLACGAFLTRFLCTDPCWAGRGGRSCCTEVVGSKACGSGVGERESERGSTVTVASVSGPSYAAHSASSPASSLSDPLPDISSSSSSSSSSSPEPASVSEDECLSGHFRRLISENKGRILF